MNAKAQTKVLFQNGKTVSIQVKEIPATNTKAPIQLLAKDRKELFLHFFTCSSRKLAGTMPYLPIMIS